MGFNIWVLLKEDWALLKWPGGCCLHQACFTWMFLAWPQALSSEFCWPVKETSLNMRKLPHSILPATPFFPCSGIWSWDTFSFFLPLPTSLLSLLSVSFHSPSPNSFSSSRPCGQLDHVSGRRLSDSLSSWSTFLTSQSILQPVRVTETLSYLGFRSVFTAALRERERELSLHSTCECY